MKKNLFTIAVTILAICASISSCKETTEPVLPSIELEKSTITFSETSQEAQQIKFTTTYAWELTYTAEWFTVTPTAGEKGESTITITLNSSDFSQELSDEITITSEEISKSITVTLSKTPETLEVDKTSISFSQENQDVQEAVVTSTYPWELTTDAEWFTVTPTQGDKGETTISVSLNTESFDEELSGTITITSGELTKTINVFLLSILILYFALLVFFLIKGIQIALKCPDRFASFGCMGCMIVIFLQSILNISVVCGIVPTTGIPLPFFSSGGSSIIVTLCMCGFIINASRCDYDTYTENKTSTKNVEEKYETLDINLFK